MTNNKISRIVKRYRKGQSLRAFAEKISEIPGVDVSHQTVKNWEDGTYEPALQTLVRMNDNRGVWQSNFAAECLSVIMPDVFTSAEEA